MKISPSKITEFTCCDCTLSLNTNTTWTASQRNCHMTKSLICWIHSASGFTNLNNQNHKISTNKLWLGWRCTDIGLQWNTWKMHISTISNQQGGWYYHKFRMLWITYTITDVVHTSHNSLLSESWAIYNADQKATAYSYRFLCSACFTGLLVA